MRFSYVKGHMTFLEVGLEDFSYTPICKKFMSCHEMEMDYSWSRFNIVISNGIDDVM